MSNSNVMKIPTNLVAGLVIISIFIISCESSSVDESLIQADKRISKDEQCVTIQDGELKYPANHYLEGNKLTTGYDVFGYNYQAHSFKGYYANLYLGENGYTPYEGENEIYLQNHPELIGNGYFMTYYWPYRNDMVNMTWNDTWLSNKDCNGDGLLDDENNTVGSGAWENYHSKGTYVDESGNSCSWVQKFKIIAVPADADLVDGIWFDSDGKEIGEDFYGRWCIIQRFINDSCGDGQKDRYQSPFKVGFGNRN